MTDKELRRLSRIDLIQILLRQSREMERLMQKNKELQSKLDERLILMENCGSIAEAALSMNHIMEAAQAAADQYLESVKEVCRGSVETQSPEHNKNNIKTEKEEPLRRENDLEFKKIPNE